jgi:hypothetical protein
VEGTNGRRGGQFGGVDSGLVVVDVGFFLEGFWAGIFFFLLCWFVYWMGGGISNIVVW